MKKTILIAALFAVAGIASAQNTASAAAAQPAAATEAAKPVEGHKKTHHAKKHVKHAAKKGDQAKAADTETVAKTGAGADQKTTSAPAK